MEALMTRLTDEEKKLRAKEAAKAKRAFIKEHMPKTYHEKIMDGRSAFKSWYESGSELHPRNMNTNEYPRRKQQLEYKRDPVNLERNRKREAEWRKLNKNYINFRSRMRTQGLFVDKKLWNIFYKLTEVEQAQVLEVNPYAPAIVRPKGLVLRRIVRERQTVMEE